MDTVAIYRSPWMVWWWIALDQSNTGINAHWNCWSPLDQQFVIQHGTALSATKQQQLYTNYNSCKYSYTATAKRHTNLQISAIQQISIQINIQIYVAQISTTANQLLPLQHQHTARYSYSPIKSINTPKSASKSIPAQRRLQNGSKSNTTSSYEYKSFCFAVTKLPAVTNEQMKWSSCYGCMDGGDCWLRRHRDQLR